MDNEPAHSPLTPEPSDRRVLFSAIAWVGVIFMFILIVLVAYAPSRSASLDKANVQARLQIRAQVEAEQEKNATTYQWVNEAEGRVRLPIDRARELIVQELKAEQAE